MKNKDLRTEAIKKAKNLLLLERDVVGVFFAKSIPGNLLNELVKPKRIYFCSAISLASKGKSLLVSPFNLICGAARRCLGFFEEELNGELVEEYCSYGVYRDFKVGKKALEATPRINKAFKLIIVGPVTYFFNHNLEPDCFLVIGEPHSIMRVVQGYNFYHGYFETQNIFAMQAVCGELTAKVVKEEKPAISLFCTGARHFGMFERSEMGISFPFKIFDEVMDGIAKTANPCEDDKTKQILLEKSKDLEKLLFYREGYIYK